jgi:hypothetical protein
LAFDIGQTKMISALAAHTLRPLVKPLSGTVRGESALYGPFYGRLRAS